jgi:hypothetical protein
MIDAVAVTPAPVAAVEGVSDAPVKADEKAPEAPPKTRPGDFARKAAAEREKVQKAQAEKARSEELTTTKAERDALKAKIAEIETRRQGYVKNPVQVLMDAFPGMEPAKAFELIGEAARNNGKAPVSAEVYALQQQMEADKAERLKAAEDEKSERQRAAQEQAQAAETAFRSEVADFIKENAETYELTALYDQHASVYAVIEATYAETGKIMPTKEAAEKVESKLEEMADRALKTKKIGAKFKAPEPETPKTLTNEMAIPSTFGGAGKNEEERMQRARAALEKLGL